MDIIVKKSCALKGNIEVPGDKSISHRALMLLPISKGKAYIHNFLQSEDCYNTLFAMRKLGAVIRRKDNTTLMVEGVPKESLRAPITPIYVGNSGTTIRLLSGILSGINGETFIYGDDSLNNRPMDRISKPLMEMGAKIKFSNNLSQAPFLIQGGNINGINYSMENTSAQVKSCIMLASLFGKGNTVINEKLKSRDHSERMLTYLDYDIKVEKNIIEIKCGGELQAKDIVVPGDASSAAFIIGAGLIIPSSEIIIRNVLNNNTRAGFIEVVINMGGNIEILDKRCINNEEVMDIRVKYSELKAVSLQGEIIPKLIDEIPLIAMLAAFSEGTTVIKNAEELKVKESNRIKSTIYNLKQLGVKVVETEDGMIIEGKTYALNKNIIFDSFNDHRIAMAFIIAGLLLEESKMANCSNIETSFPGFVNLMLSLGANISIV